jgi:hypothetical protein
MSLTPPAYDVVFSYVCMLCMLKSYSRIYNVPGRGGSGVCTLILCKFRVTLCMLSGVCQCVCRSYADDPY